MSVEVPQLRAASAPSFSPHRLDVAAASAAVDDALAAVSHGLSGGAMLGSGAGGGGGSMGAPSAASASSSGSGSGSSDGGVSSSISLQSQGLGSAVMRRTPRVGTPRLSAASTGSDHGAPPPLAATLQLQAAHQAAQGEGAGASSGAGALRSTGTSALAGNSGSVLSGAGSPLKLALGGEEATLGASAQLQSMADAAVRSLPSADMELPLQASHVANQAARAIAGAAVDPTLSAAHRRPYAAPAPMDLLGMVDQHHHHHHLAGHAATGGSKGSSSDGGKKSE